MDEAKLDQVDFTDTDMKNMEHDHTFCSAPKPSATTRRQAPPLKKNNEYRVSYAELQPLILNPETTKKAERLGSQQVKPNFRRNRFTAERLPPIFLHILTRTSRNHKGKIPKNKNI